MQLRHKTRDQPELVWIYGKKQAAHFIGNRQEENENTPPAQFEEMEIKREDKGVGAEEQYYAFRGSR